MPVGEEQTAAAQDEDVRQVVVHGNGAGEAGKVGECGVGTKGSAGRRSPWW